MLNAQLHIGISTQTNPPLPEVNILMVEIPPPKPYIFMIRVNRQIKCLIAQVPGVIPHPLPEVNFLMVEIPTLKPYVGGGV
jgi:hypothetical protein